MTTRAKFVCQSKTESIWGGTVTGTVSVFSYKFTPPVDDSEENKRFYKATPAGYIELSAIRNDLFTPGKEYYVDFTPAI